MSLVLLGFTTMFGCFLKLKQKHTFYVDFYPESNHKYLFLFNVLLILFLFPKHSVIPNISINGKIGLNFTTRVIQNKKPRIYRKYIFLFVCGFAQNKQILSEKLID